jgi:predicted nuclease of predicted toxin-antitoxin system
MKFLADEGIDKKLVIVLRNLDFEVEYVVETQFGRMDKDLLNHAFINNQVILTKDKDFGELIFKEELNTKGVVLIRLENVTSSERVEMTIQWFKKLNWDFETKFITITQNQARVIDLAR